MAKVERIDVPDSLVSIFRVEIAPNQHQEIQVPIFLADFAESQIRTMNFDQEKNRNGKTDILE